MGFKKLAATVIVVMGALTMTGCGIAGLLSASSASKPSSVSQANSGSEYSDRYDSKKSIKGGRGEKADGKIWFDEEPRDPLEKLVYASQRFVDKPLQLRTIEAGEGIHPNFIGKPDICDPQAAERLLSIGLVWSNTTPIHMDSTVYYCSYHLYDGKNMEGVISLNLANFPLEKHITKDFGSNLFEVNGGGDELSCIGVFATSDNQYMYAMYGDSRISNYEGTTCKDVSLARQLFMNIQGGKHASISTR